MNSPYDNVPDCVLKKISPQSHIAESYCAGFELNEWWCDGFAENLIEWISDYALKADELTSFNHTNPYTRLKQAAARVYKSEKYERRGEVGEIVAYTVCRKYFQTIPVAPRVNYLSASNDVVKAFDLVHVRYTNDQEVELWLGEAKFFEDRDSAIRDAIKSIEEHITLDFLKNEKLLLCPQVSSDIPHSEKIRHLLSSSVSLNHLIKQAVFPVLIAANSDATSSHNDLNEKYYEQVRLEMDALWKKLEKSNLTKKIKLFLIYVPLGDKNRLNCSFDRLLKGLQGGAN